MNYELKKVSFVRIWAEALDLFLGNFVPLVVIAVIGVLPLLFFPQPTGPGGEEITLEAAALDLITWFIFLVGVNTLTSALMIEYIYKKYLGLPQTVSRYIETVLSHLPAIIGLSILEALAVVLGFIAFFVPGVYLALSLSLAVEILIIERKGVIESMKRSFFLTQGKKVEILFFTLTLALLSLLFEKTLDLIFSVVDKSQMGVDINVITLLFTQALLTPLGACLFILIYFNIRKEKEGFDREHIIGQIASADREHE